MFNVKDIVKYVEVILTQILYQYINYYTFTFGNFEKNISLNLYI